MPNTIIAATIDHCKVYNELMTAVTTARILNPMIQDKEIAAMLGRILGCCIAKCSDEEQDRVRTTAIVNMDRAVEEQQSQELKTKRP